MMSSMMSSKTSSSAARHREVKAQRRRVVIRAHISRSSCSVSCNQLPLSNHLILSARIISMDDLFPGIEFGGTEDIFSALHEAELLKGQDLPIPRHRFSMEDALGFTTVQERSRLKVLSKIIPDGPPFKKRQVLNMIEDFVALHQRSDGLGEGRYVGREASKEEFVGQYLSLGGAEGSFVRRSTLRLP